MSATLSTPVDSPSDQVEDNHWALPHRIAFRFCFIYFGMYCLVTQVLGGLLPVPKLDIPSLGELTPMLPMVLWTAKHVFGYEQAVVYQGSGSGDKVFDWVQVFCLLAIAFAATLAWSLIDRRRTHYETLHKWLRLFLRFAVAGQLLAYGIVKVFPLQMAFPYLRKLVERYGDFSPMGVLWASVGASPAYEMFVGGAEVLAGLLLMVPATSMLGALICLIDMIEVFVLNMTYDVPVKLFSFHMILMAVFLLIPDRRRLIHFSFRECAVPGPDVRPLFTTERANRLALITQIVFGLLLVSGDLENIRENWSKFGGGAPKSPLYGIWNIDEMRIDGVVRSPLLTDYDRWRRVIFESPKVMSFQRMDDSIEGLTAAVDEKKTTLALSKPKDKNWKGQLVFQRQGIDRMTLDGQMGPHKMRMQLSRMDRSKFLLVNRGFHWVQDYPFNR